MNIDQVTIAMLTASVVKQQEALNQMDTMLRELLDRTDMLGNRMWRTRWQLLDAIKAKPSAVRKQTKAHRPVGKRSVSARRASKQA